MPLLVQSLRWWVRGNQMLEGLIRMLTEHILIEHIPLFALNLASELRERGEQGARVALSEVEQAMAHPRWWHRLIPQVA
ncbi:MAG: hypothetical protein RMK32_01375 [Anaerolineae bacterium]|nr:hypothetical protein [Thermoflexus sp.]MDW8064266.1 hypothetical protein [Anaerolineae bacterium]